MQIDVIMPVYNTRADYLLEAIYSIIDQTFKNFRLVIIDDGSTDENTLAALVIAKAVDHRIEVFHMKHGGTPMALNHGHKIAKTEYVAIMGSDDISHPERLEKQVNYLKENPKVDVLGTSLVSYKTWDPFRKPTLIIRKPEVVSKERGFIVGHGTAMYRLALARKIGEYKKELLRAQDINFFLRMKAAGAVMHNLPDVLYWWRRYS